MVDQLEYRETTPLQIPHYTASKLPLNTEPLSHTPKFVRPYRAVNIAKEVKLAGARRAQLSSPRTRSATAGRAL